MRRASGAERGAHGHLRLARERARQQQIRDVGARDEQHEADRADEHDERASDVADHLLVERHDAERQPAVGRIDLRVDRAAAARSARPSRPAPRRHAHAALQLADDVVVLAVRIVGGVRAERQREHDLGVLGAVQRRHHFARERERRRQHADDLIRLRRSARGSVPITLGSPP